MVRAAELEGGRTSPYAGITQIRFNGYNLRFQASKAVHHP